MAIGGVLLAHAELSFAEGGFVGVDVFYVISGFLITRLLVAELERTGTISMVGFYARRARRLLPVATLVLVTVLIVSLFILSPVRRDLLAGDAVASSLYVVNWRFVAQSADYFGASTDVSPLQHYWSLAIEEQFYLVWPALLLLASLWWLRRRGTISRPAIAAILAAIAVTSFTYSVVATADSPEQAFFSTFTRAWELALGGLLALVAIPRLPRPVASALGLAGLGAIVASTLILTETTPFPGAVAAVPVLGAVAIIAAGAAASDTLGARALSVRPVRYVGRISYSWYLWHWPFAIFAAALFTSLPSWGIAAAVALSFIPASLSHHLLERPAMRAPALRLRPRRSLAMGGACALAGLATAAVVVVAQPELRTAPANEVAGATALSEQTEPQQQATALRPNPLQASQDKGQLAEDGCLVGRSELTSGPCAYGPKSAPTRVVLLGDSHANQFFPALQRIGARNDWRLVGLTKQGCAPGAALVNNGRLGREYTECEEWREYALQRIEQDPPDMVVVSTATYYSVVEDGEKVQGRENQAILEAAYRSTLERLEATGAKVVVIRDIPHSRFDVSDCVSDSLDSLQDCAFPYEDRRNLRKDFDVRAAERLEGVEIVDVDPVLCPDDLCRAVIGDVIVYRGTNHVTASFARTLARAIEDQLPEEYVSGAG